MEPLKFCQLQHEIFVVELKIYPFQDHYKYPSYGRIELNYTDEFDDPH